MKPRISMITYLEAPIRFYEQGLGLPRMKITPSP